MSDRARRRSSRAYITSIAPSSQSTSDGVSLSAQGHAPAETDPSRFRGMFRGMCHAHVLGYYVSASRLGQVRGLAYRAGEIDTAPTQGGWRFLLLRCSATVRGNRITHAHISCAHLRPRLYKVVYDSGLCWWRSGSIPGCSGLPTTATAAAAATAPTATATAAAAASAPPPPPLPRHMSAISPVDISLGNKSAGMELS